CLTAVIEPHVFRAAGHMGEHMAEMLYCANGEGRLLLYCLCSALIGGASFLGFLEPLALLLDPVSELLYWPPVFFRRRALFHPLIRGVLLLRFKLLPLFFYRINKVIQYPHDRPRYRKGCARI